MIICRGVGEVSVGDDEADIVGHLLEEMLFELESGLGSIHQGKRLVHEHGRPAVTKPVHMWELRCPGTSAETEGGVKKLLYPLVLVRWWLTKVII